MELPKNKIKISASVKTITYRKDNFYIFTIDKPDNLSRYRNKNNNHLLTCKCYTDIDLKIGDFLEIEGFLKDNGEYGYSLDCKGDINKSLIVTLEGFSNFLKTFKGLGPKKIEILVSLYSDDVSNSKRKFLFDVMNKDEKLAKALGKNLFEKIYSQVDEMPEELMSDKEKEFIEEFGLTNGFVNKIKKASKKSIIEVFEDDIYKVSYDRKYRGLGFKTIDAIAKKTKEKLKISDEDFNRNRLTARIYFVLLEAENDGHVFLRYNGVKYFLKELKLGDIDEAYFEKIVKDLIEQKSVYEEDKRYYVYKNYETENRVRQNISERMSVKSVDLRGEDFSFDEGFTPSEKQKEAIEKALTSNIMVLTGGPGTGKTTIAKYIYKELSKRNLKILLMAPTGTAARRISQVIGCSATTIHRGIKFNGSSAKFNKENPLQIDVLMVDESSMIDLNLADYLLRAIKPETKIIFIGDIEQLPSVGIGSVLEDLQKAKVDTVKLDRVYRQQESNPIVDFAYDVNNKKTNYYGYLSRFLRMEEKLNVYMKKEFQKKDYEDTYTLNMQDGAIETALEYYQMYNIMEVQLLTQLRQGQKGTSDSINKIIQREINKSPFIPGVKNKDKYKEKFKVGDKVMQTRNNYGKEIFNGSIGIIREYREEKREVLIDFIDGDGYFEVIYLVPEEKGEIEKNENIYLNLDLAYAMTIHKSQGQEFKAIVLLVNNYFFINKKMIYTGITRAREKATVVSNHSILQHGIKTEYGIKEINGKLVEVKRNSTLAERIIEFNKTKK